MKGVDCSQAQWAAIGKSIQISEKCFCQKGKKSEQTLGTNPAVLSRLLQRLWAAHDSVWEAAVIGKSLLNNYQPCCSEWKEAESFNQLSFKVFFRFIQNWEKRGAFCISPNVSDLLLTHLCGKWVSMLWLTRVNPAAPLIPNFLAPMSTAIANKYILKFRQIHITIRTITWYNLDKYIS